MVFPVGPLVNALAIVAGGLAGLALSVRMPERVRCIVFQGLGLCVFILGVQQASLEGVHPMLTIASIVGGGIVGELLRLEDRMGSLSDILKARLCSSNPRFTEGLLNASVIFCVGAMAILGAFEEGLRGARDIVYTKAIIDAFTAMIMASAMGVGVLFSGAVVFAYQGVLVVGAGALSSLLSPPVMAELTATGGIILMGIGINMLGLLQIRLANLVPALLLAVVLAQIFL